MTSGFECVMNKRGGNDFLLGHPSTSDPPEENACAMLDRSYRYLSN